MTFSSLLLLLLGKNFSREMRLSQDFAKLRPVEENPRKQRLAHRQWHYGPGVTRNKN